MAADKADIEMEARINAAVEAKVAEILANSPLLKGKVYKPPLHEQDPDYGTAVKSKLKPAEVFEMLGSLKIKEILKNKDKINLPGFLNKSRKSTLILTNKENPAFRIRVHEDSDGTYRVIVTDGKGQGANIHVKEGKGIILERGVYRNVLALAQLEVEA